MRTERQIHGEVSDGSAQCADDDELQDENISDGDDPGPIIEGAAQYSWHYAPGAEQDGQNRDRPPVARQGDAEHVQIPFPHPRAVTGLSHSWRFAHDIPLAVRLRYRTQHSRS